MADRTASVALKLEAGQFKAEAAVVEGKVRGVDREVDKLDRDITKIPADAARAGAAMKLLSGDVKDVGTNFQHVGDKSTGLSVLDARIKNTRAEVKKLSEEFVKTGDVDVFHKLGRASGDLSVLTDMRKKLANSVERGLKEGVEKGGPEAASTFSQLFEGGIIDALSNPYVAAAAGVLAAIVGPLIGAAIGGAIIAAGAVGGVALGVAGAVQADPKRIGAAWDAEIKRIKTEWIDASRAFVGPTEQAIHILGAEVSKIPLDTMLAKASKFVEPLARGVAGLVGGIGQGAAALIDKAGPIIAVLKEELPQLGRAVEMALTNIAGGGKGAADGLRDILHVVEALIVGFGAAIRIAEDVWHAVHMIADELDRLGGSVAWDADKPKAYAVSLDGAAHGMDNFASASESGLGSLDALNSKISQTATTVDTVWSGMVDKALDQMLNLDRATLGWQESLTRLDESVKRNGKSLDIHTAKGQANRSAILDGVAANKRLYDAEVASGTSAEEAGKHFVANEDALRAAAIAAGYNATEVDKMIKQYGKVPPTIQTQIEMHGLAEAIANLDETLRLINHMPPRKSVNIDVNVHGNLFAASSAISNVLGSGFVSSGLGKKKRAGGGPVEKGLTYLVGEQGPEMFTAPANGQIMTAGKTSAMLHQSRPAGNTYGFSVSPRPGGGTTRFEHTLKVVDGSSGRSGLATLVAQMARTGELQITSRAIVN